MAKKRKKVNKEHIYGLLFITPAMLQFLVFFLIPLIICIYASFTNWNALSPNKTFIGIKNYLSMFQDAKFWKALMNTFYMLIPIPVYLILSMLFALACHKNVPGNKVFRVIYYLPYISSIVALVIIWKWLFNSEFGLVNNLLQSWFGIVGPNWLNDPVWTKRMIVIMISWKLIGITAIYYLAALKNIPATYYEAARVDGATSWKQFTRITLPLLTPTTFYLTVVGSSDPCRHLLRFSYLLQTAEKAMVWLRLSIIYGKELLNSIKWDMPARRQPCSVCLYLL